MKRHLEISCSEEEREIEKVYIRKTEKIKSCIAFLNVLPKDIIQIIINYMDRCALNLFLRLNRQTHALYATNMVDAWKKQFEKTYLANATIMLINDLKLMFPRIHDYIMKMLSEQDAIIVGNYVLQFLCNVAFKGSNVDIFFRVDKNMKTMSNAPLDVYVHDLLERYFNPNHSPKRYYQITFHNTPKPGYKIPNLIRLIVNVQIDNVNAQIIFFDLDEGKTLEQHLEDYYDISFCKCSFNGQSIKTKYLFEQLNREGRILALKDYKKTSYFESTRAIRIEKYKSRGFKFIE
jgi:hypothetical protein